MAELFGKSLASGRSEPLTQSRICSESNQGIGKLFDIAGFDEEARFIRDADFACAVDVITDDWFPGDQPLGKNSGETFAETGMDDDVHRTDQFGDLTAGDESGEDEVPYESG